MKQTIASLLIALLIAVSPFLYGTEKSDSSKIYFENAFGELKKMLEEKTPSNFEQAVFISENAYHDNKYSYQNFQKGIDVHLYCVKKLIEANNKSDSIDFNVKVNANGRFKLDDIRYLPKEKKELYRKALTNWAIFTYLTDTTFLYPVFHLPFNYATHDPFGMKDWSNSQVINLLISKEQKGNCFALTGLFKILSDRLNSEARICTAPQHIYIQHRDTKGDYYNVELATAGHPGDGFIQVLTYTTSDAIKSGIALRSYDEKQSIGLCLINLAKSYEHKFQNKEDEFILRCADLVLKYDSLNLNALLLKQQALDAKVTNYAAKNKVSDINRLKQDAKISKTLSGLEKHIALLYRLGYRQMPMDMQQMVLDGFKKEDNGSIQINKNPSPFTTVKPKDPNDAQYWTLTHGAFQEVFEQRELEPYGHFILKTATKKITAIDTASRTGFLIDPVAFAYDFGSRMYDARLGMFISIDPEHKIFPAWSPYSAFMDNPIFWNDPGGDCPFCPYLDAIVDIGFALYDVGEITYDYITKGQVDPISVAALSADLVSIAVPLSTGAGLAVRAGSKGVQTLSRTAQVTKVAVKNADEVNEIAIKAMKERGIKNPQAPYKVGSKVTEGVLEKDVSLVRLSGPKNVEGSFFVDPSEIKGLTPSQIKDKLSLKYEPTVISEVTLKKGAQIRTGTAAGIEEFGTKGGGLQIELLDKNVKDFLEIKSTTPLQ